MHSHTSRDKVLDSFPEEKSPTEKASKKLESGACPDSSFVFRILIPLGLKWVALLVLASWRIPAKKVYLCSDESGHVSDSFFYWP